MSVYNDTARFYNSWQKMHTRCYDPAYHSYHRYGGRGITVCDRWHSFEKFKEDLLDTWFPGATLDRLNNDKGYDPYNCAWKTAAENKKPFIYDHEALLKMYESGMSQKEIGATLGLGQDRISKLLKKARQLRKQSEGNS